MADDDDDPSFHPFSFFFFLFFPPARRPILFSFFFLRGHVRFRSLSLFFIVTPPLFPFSFHPCDALAQQSRAEQKLKLKRKMTMMERRASRFPPLGSNRSSAAGSVHSPHAPSFRLRLLCPFELLLLLFILHFFSFFISFFLSFFHPISILIFCNLPLSARSVSHGGSKNRRRYSLCRSLRTGAMKENQIVGTRVNKGTEEGENILKCIKSKWDLGSDRAQPTLTADADADADARVVVVVVHLLHEMLLSPSPLLSTLLLFSLL